MRVVRKAADDGSAETQNSLSALMMIDSSHRWLQSQALCQGHAFLTSSWQSLITSNCQMRNPWPREGSGWPGTVAGLEARSATTKSQ